MKRRQSFYALSTLRRRNLKTEVSLSKRIKCFPSPPRRRNLKTEASLWKRIKCFPSTVRRRNLKTKASLWKRVKCFPSTLRRGNLKTNNEKRSFWICAWGKLSRGSPMIIVTSSVFKMFSAHTKTQAGVFKFLRSEERFLKAPFSWQISVDGRPNRRNNAPFSNSSGVVWTGPESCSKTNKLARLLGYVRGNALKPLDKIDTRHCFILCSDCLSVPSFWRVNIKCVFAGFWTDLCIKIRRGKSEVTAAT